VRTYRGCETGSEHYLTQAKLRIPPKWLKTQTYKIKYNVTKLNYCMMRASDGCLHKESHNK
jgi:hypothetical protein